MSQLDREGAERGPHDPLRSFPTPCFVTLRCHHRCRTSYWAILVAASGVDCRVLHLGSPRTKTGLPWWLSGKESACQCRRLKRAGLELWVGEDPLENEMATNSSGLAWEIPWTEESGGLQSMRSQKRHNSAIDDKLTTSPLSNPLVQE